MLFADDLILCDSTKKKTGKVEVSEGGEGVLKLSRITENLVPASSPSKWKIRICDSGEYAKLP